MSFNILIICTGNTCRSAMAEGILKRMLSEVGDSDVQVQSAGVGTFPGWEASKEAVLACREMQVDISQHRSQPVTLELIRQSDLILTMEQMHSDRIVAMDTLAVPKVKLLTQFDPRARQPSIEDPVGQSLPVFRKCADRIFSALQGVMKELKELKKKKAEQKHLVARVAIGGDHRGYQMKEALVEFLKAKGYEVADCGAYSPESSDHPDQAFAVAELVRDHKVDRGVLVCSNGVGMTIAANKVSGVYAALVSNTKNARQAREHNGANVLCLPGDSLEMKEAQEILDVFLTTETLEGEGARYQRRRDKIRKYEIEHSKEEPTH